MNNNKRFFLGLLSSLLLACGFVRAAERMDPMTSSQGSIHSTLRTGGGPECIALCAIDDNGK